MDVALISTLYIPHPQAHRKYVRNQLHAQLAEDDICPVHIAMHSYTLKVSVHAYLC